MLDFKKPSKLQVSAYLRDQIRARSFIFSDSSLGLPPFCFFLRAFILDLFAKQTHERPK
jgi:hypothetical protein